MSKKSINHHHQLNEWLSRDLYSTIVGRTTENNFR